MRTGIRFAICGPMHLLIALVATLSGCSNLQPGFDEPQVSINSLRLAPADGTGSGPYFEIGLRIVNPNDEPLRLSGAAYTVSLEGYDILTGAADNLPTVDAYSEATVIIKAQPNLLDSMRLFGKLMKQPGDSISYELSAKLDTANFINPIRVTDSGAISLVADGGAAGAL